MPIHPKYGSYDLGWKKIVDFPNYEINEHFQIRNITSGSISTGDSHNRFRFRKHNKIYHRHIYRICLITFFPTIVPLETVDHIDENHNHHHIENLQWMTRSDNVQKSNSIRPRNNGKARSKPVQQWSCDRKTLIMEFISLMDASKKTGINVGNIGACARGKQSTAKGFYWKYKNQDDHQDLHGEEWKTSDELKKILQKYRPTKPLSEKSINKILVSNMGRILTSKGIKTKGHIHNIKYRRYAGAYVHQLVWSVWGTEPIDNTKQILHDDSQPLDEDGCVSNAIKYLRLGTQSENMKECCTIGSRRKRSIHQL